ANAIFAAGIPDDDFAASHARCAGDTVVFVLADGLSLPDDLASLLVKRDEPRVERADVHFAVVKSDATVCRATTNARTRTNFVGFSSRSRGEIHMGDLRIPAPFFLSRARIHSDDDAPRQRCVHHAVRHDRSTLDRTAVGTGVVIPREAKAAHIRPIDLLEWTVALLGVISAVR